ncbi:dihydrolipoyl dehydrogenase [[Mycoplasma] testudinis]|uniref:dihydrolipoyl dehydrogenase n=1 Tax=[Mycoplasma] testudinis TaxID=33924 RepID=UPI0005671175|nr:dihydrolipoyl dehydrogenase [[Mycoplasma] testudinis]
MNNFDFDLIIIGAGPGGYMAAEQAGHYGKKVLIIEKGMYGGVCLNIGCIPTKALIKSGKIAHYLENASSYGIEFSENASFKPNWAMIQTRKQKVVDTLVNGVKYILKAAKATVIEGEASFIDDHTVQVNGKNYTGENILVATGSRNRSLNLPGFAESYKSGKMIGSTEALNLPSIPRRFTVIGGGVIGIEIATIYRSMHAEVTIVQGLDRILEKLDSDISRHALRHLTDYGVKVILNAKIIKSEGGNLHINVDGKDQVIEGDYILESVGRKVNDELLEPLNLDRDEKGHIKLNEYLQTSKPHIYMAGDVTGQMMLAHYAYHQARFVVDHILHHNPMRVLPLFTPGCIYTHSEIATIGYTEEYLKDHNIPYVKAVLPMTSNGKAIADGETRGMMKMLANKENGQILGVHMISSASSDMISEIAVALTNGMTVFDIYGAIHPHPAIAESIGDAARKIIYENFKDHIFNIQ